MLLAVCGCQSPTNYLTWCAIRKSEKTATTEAELAERATGLLIAENRLAELEAKLVADEQALAERITAQAVAAETAKTATKAKAK